MKAVVLVEPEIPENTGFIARLCENFGYELRIVNPEFNLEDARKTASKAQQKLEEAHIYNQIQESIKDLDYIVGTKPGKGSSLENFQARENTSIMIGRESSGLSNKELELCDSIVHIETDDYSSINQSHAAGILMNNFSKKSEKNGISQGQKQVLDEMIQNEVLKELVLDANPSQEKVNHLIGQLKQEE